MNYSRYTTDPVSIVVLVILYLAVTFILSLLFEKAGRPKLLAFIPFVNLGVLFEIAGFPWWNFFLLIVPLLGWQKRLAKRKALDASSLYSPMYLSPCWR